MGNLLGDTPCTPAYLARIYALYVNAQTRCDNTSSCSGYGVLSNRGCAAPAELDFEHATAPACGDRRRHSFPRIAGSSAEWHEGRAAKRASRTTAATIASFVMHALQACA